MGTNDGPENERRIHNFLNNKKIISIEECSLKKFVNQICIDNKIEIKNDTIIKVETPKKKSDYKGSSKIDRVFVINEQKFNISFKKGKSNAFHQELENTFTKFLINLNISKENLIIFNNHLRNKKTKIRHSSLADFFEKNKKDIIKRALDGRFDDFLVNYFYFTETINKFKDGVFTNYKIAQNLLNTMKSKGKGSTASIGRLTYQAYGRKRGTSIQLKWNTAFIDLKNLK